ncbi:MAG TPA: hypothetical protein VGB63_16340 [Pedobacter sp.]|jgi:hypothetical protein
MKNRAVTYLLIVSVAAVWGVIFYQIFKVSGDKESLQGPAIRHSADNKSLDNYEWKDTLKLALNYRDPFLSSSNNAVALPTLSDLDAAVVPTTPKLRPLISQVNWEGIKYTGFIMNTPGKRLVAILNIYGKEQFLSEGESAAGVRLISNMRDSVKLAYQNNIKYIRIQ